MAELLTIKQASKWASSHLKRNVTSSNISYLIQYGRIRKIEDNGNVLIDRQELLNYYESFFKKRELEWKSKLGNDINWTLSFEQLKEADTTKHVHRLHPYKGKFIPQLVEYFLDTHKDNFKKDVYFEKEDIVLDPFCGSGTALVQANELGLHAIGIDISVFNALLTNTKLDKYDFNDLRDSMNKISNSLHQFVQNSNILKFEKELTQNLANFNGRFFKSPEFKRKVRNKEIDEEHYGNEKEKEFLRIYRKLINRYGIKLEQNKPNSFLDKWYIQDIRAEIDFALGMIKKIENPKTRNVLNIILSRTIRSCRATTHADLATLKEPITTTYYCSKHGKICKPIFSITGWWGRYSKDTIKRLAQFDKLRTDTYQVCFAGDSRNFDIFDALEKYDNDFHKIAKNQKIKGIFSSPPYVGLIDYHGQHAYAYDLFGFERKDEFEIGHLSRGQSNGAKNSYVDGISQVLNNFKKFLADDYNVFLVANDRHNLYPIIADKCNMKIIAMHKRPVLNRTEKDKGVYSETIFHLKAK